MAYRIHVTAVRDCPVEEARDTYSAILGPAFQNVEIYRNSGWTWFMTSVWGVNASDLNTGLCQLARPALQFTTSDGCRWYLTVHGGPSGPRNFLYEFGTFSHQADPARDQEMEDDARYADESEALDPELAFLEDEPEAAKRPRVAFDAIAEDFKEWSAALPEPLVESLRELPYSQAMKELRDWYVELLPQALEEAGLTVDSQAVRAVLLWEDAKPLEHDSDLGNLPRLLSTLGLGGHWDDFVKEADKPAAVGEAEVDDEDEPESHGQEVDHARDVLDRLSSLPLAEVEGGPVPILAKHLSRVGLASDACSTGPSPNMAVLLSLPSSKRRRAIELPATRGQQVQVVATDEGVLRFGFLNRIWFNRTDLEDALGKPLTRLLLKPPKGTLIEAAFAVADQPATYHRFRGVIGDDGFWQVERSSPRLSRETLADALDVAAFESKDTIKCRDEAEARALERAALRDQFLHGMGVTRNGNVVSVEFDTGNLAKILLRLRHPSAWDFGPVEAEMVREYQERMTAQRAMRRRIVEATRQRAAPHDTEILLKGRHSLYWKSDFLLLTDLDQEPREAFERIMETLGFTRVGDLVVKKQRDLVTRLFLSGDRRSYGLIMAKKTMYLGVEFVSRLNDGSGLTTTTNAMVESNPKAGIYYRDFPGLEPEALYRKHLQGLQRFRARKGLEPVELEGTLIGIAREIEIAFDRQQAVENE